MENKEYQTILKTTNDKGNVIEICYNPLSCEGYNIIIDGKMTDYNEQFYCNALVYVYKELRGFEELRVLFPNYGLEEKDFIYILDSLKYNIDKVIMEHEKGEMSIYDCSKEKISIFLDIHKDGYKNLNKIINSKHFVELAETKEEFLDNLEDFKNCSEESGWDIHLCTKINI